jgi:hypothetical protein
LAVEEAAAASASWSFRRGRSVRIVVGVPFRVARQRATLGRPWNVSSQLFSRGPISQAYPLLEPEFQCRRRGASSRVLNERRQALIIAVERFSFHSVRLSTPVKRRVFSTRRHSFPRSPSFFDVVSIIIFRPSSPTNFLRSVTLSKSSPRKKKIRERERNYRPC